MKYKLLKDLPNVGKGEIISSYGIDYKDERHFFKRELSIGETVIKENPEWFAPFLFNTEDGVDIYFGDRYYYLGTYGLCSDYISNYIDYKYNKFRFSTREAALIYLAKQKYPVGTKVRCYITNTIRTIAHHQCPKGVDNYVCGNGDVWLNAGEYNVMVYDNHNGKWAEIVPQFEVGKWYSINEGDEFIKFNSSDKEAIYGEGITKKHLKFHNNWWIYFNHIKNYELLTDLSVIQPYLPDNHVDKVVEYKVGDFIYIHHLKQVYKITEILNCGTYLTDYKDSNCFQAFPSTQFRKATEKEIISYYEKLGWVKGAKFKYKKDVYSVLYISSHSVQGDLLSITDNVKGGYVSTLIKDCELIKQPELPKSWEELEEISGFYIDEDFSEICPLSGVRTDNTKNLFKTEKQAESALAFAQLSQLVDKYNEGWVADWSNTSEKWCVVRLGNFLEVNKRTTTWHNLPFKSKELAEFSLKHHNDLWKKYNELT